MKVFASLITLAAMAFLTGSQASALPNRPVAECAQPVILEIASTATGGLSYKIGGRAYSGYPLDDLHKSLSGCKVSRPLYVVIDYRVPSGDIPGAVASKLQADNVRYFIRYPEQEHSVVEIKIVGYDSKLP
jgi:hypothetical protein